MKIYVDSDACPVLDAVVELAGRAGVEVVVAHSRHHNIERNEDHVDVRETGDRADAADHYIFNQFDVEDLVVTDDLGLATLVLGRGGRVLRFRGDQPTEDDIEMRLAMREASRRERQKSNRVKGPSEFTDRDRERFRHALEEILGLD